MHQQPAMPEVHMTRMKGQGLGPDSPSENFNNFHGEKGGGGSREPEAQPSSVQESIVVRPYPGRPIRAEVLDDWSAKVGSPFVTFVSVRDKNKQRFNIKVLNSLSYRLPNPQMASRQRCWTQNTSVSPTQR